ncbi:hypothetical protein GUJ93_ZPchr0010g11145 [Zizania palustris]|uniref:Uncharacterized protein n=1 Tax=Zizania palustris TaxID=103762 RepID=A0A8J6BDJ0_ZIZPA|nr:hypothetical protein GUJ93_ZPchr0010g11145 [Zizania palustris]
MSPRIIRSGRRPATVAPLPLLLLISALLVAMHAGCAVAVQKGGGGAEAAAAAAGRRMLGSHGSWSRPGSPMPNSGPGTIRPPPAGCCDP